MFVILFWVDLDWINIHVSECIVFACDVNSDKLMSSNRLGRGGRGSFMNMRLFVFNFITVGVLLYNIYVWINI